MSTPVSDLQKARSAFKPVLPALLRGGPAAVVPRFGKPAPSPDAIRKFFPKTSDRPLVGFAKGKNPAARKRKVRLGAVLSGGQAPGGHNVIAGIFDSLREANSNNRLFGFLGGPSGILENKWKEITPPFLEPYRNTGGFDMIQSGRTKIETPEQFEQAKRTLLENKLDGLVVIGGDDSNTNAALLAEFFMERGAPVSVIGVPKTIDGDLKNEHIEASFGFDTATKIYSELVGNIGRDILSARKYWHFVRLMGRSASHITLEVALRTNPNVALVGEEVLARKMTLSQVVDSVAQVVARRAEKGKDYGLLLLPEGLIEFIPEVKALIAALNDALAAQEGRRIGGDFGEQRDSVLAVLPSELAKLMRSLPLNLQAQLLLDRDPHGNVRVSQIETERTLADMVKTRLAEMKKAGSYSGKFAAITHFFGYEGRCGAPSNFDANYCYALGYNAAVLALNGQTGYLSSMRNLLRPSVRWECGGVPLTMMMNIERRKGKETPVIEKALVKLDGAPFRTLEKSRDAWAMDDRYLSPGPIQYFGPVAVTDAVTQTLELEQGRR